VWGRTLCGEVGNRIGGHKKRSFLYGTVRPRVNSACGIIYNPRPLAFEACLKRLALTQQVSMPWNRHHGTKAIKIKMIRNSVSTSPGTDQFTRLGSSLVLCTAGFASVRSTISRYGVDCQSMQAFTPPAGLESPHRCNRTIGSWKERSGSSTSPIGLAVHEYHLVCVHIHILMNNEFSTLVQSQNNQSNQNSNNKSDSCPRT
jgi:hypothetical protein